jgi:hypothetical protein
MVALRTYFNASLPPDDDQGSTAVIRITPSNVEHYQVDFGAQAAEAPAFLTPFDDGFYAMCKSLTLCKWAGNRFETANEGEQQRLDGINRLVHGDMNNQIVNGWSARQLPRAPRAHFEADIAGKYSIQAQDLPGNARQYSRISVSLLRPGQRPQSLYDVDGTPRRVSRAEYRKLFSGS